MTDAKHCIGCRDDFYNGKNQIGVKECWMRKNATLVPRLIIHVDQPPPYLGIKERVVPDCFKMDRHVTVNAAHALDAKGYWKG